MSAAPEIDELRPDEVATLLSFWSQIGTIDDRKWTAFTERAWTDLAEYIHTYVVQHGNAEATWNKIRKSHFRVCLPESYSDYYRKLRDASAGKLEDLPEAGDGLPADAAHVTADGTIVVPIPKDIAEVLWLLQAIEPWLHNASERWQREVRFVTGEHNVAALRQELIKTIHDYVYAQKRVAKLRLLAALPAPLPELIGTDSRELTEFLNEFDALTDYTAAVKDVERMTAEEAQQLVDEARQQAATQITPMLDELERRSIEVKNWIDLHGVQLQRLRGYYQRLLHAKYVDYPPDAAEQRRAFLRFTLSTPGVESYSGSGTSVSASLSLCRATDGLSVTASDAQGPITVREGEGDGELRAYEQIPLGISVSGLSFRDAHGTGGTLVPLPSLAPRVRVDEPTLRAAMRRLGVPEAISIGNVRVRMTRVDRYEITARFSAPKLGAGLPSLRPDQRGAVVVLTIDAEKISLEADLPIRELLREQIKEIQKSHDQALRDALVAASTPTMAVESVEPKGEWLDGLIGYRVQLRVRKLGDWTVPNHVGQFGVTLVCEYTNGSARLRIATRTVPGPLLDWLREKLADALLAPVVAELRRNPNFDRLGEYVRIRDAVYDPGAQSISAQIVFMVDQLPEGMLPLPTAQVAIDLRNGAVDISSPSWAQLRDRLKAEAAVLLDELSRRLTGELTREIAERIEREQIELQILGAGFRVTKARYERGVVSVDAEGTGHLDGLKVKGLRIVEIDAEALKVDLFDFGDAEVTLDSKPALEALVARLGGIDQEYLRITQECWTREGVRFDVMLSLEFLGDTVPLGTVTLGPNGVDLQPLDALDEVFEEKVLEYLARDVLVIPDMGPVRNVKLIEGRTKLLNGLEIWISGEADVSGFGFDVGIPFEARLAPSFRLVLDEAALEQAATTAFLSLLPADLLGGISNVELLVDSAPYGAKFDVDFTAWVFKVEADDLRLTTAGFELPPELAIQLPGMIPVPSNFAIVNPGIVVALKQDGDVGVVGDVTLLGTGVDKIVKLRSKLTTKITELGTFNLDGTMVLAEALPIMKIEGLADFRTGRLRLDTRTTGLIDKLIQISAGTSVNAKEGEFSQPGSIGVLGLRLAETNIQVRAFGDPPHIRAVGQVNIPIASVNIDLQASPKLSHFKANAQFDVRIGDFTLNEAALFVDQRVVDLKFNVLVFNVRILAPSITTMTPERVLGAILGLFDFDVSSFLDAAINRNVTISFFEQTDSDPTQTDQQIGNGDPPPPDSRNNGAPEDSVSPPPDEQEQGDEAEEPTGDPPQREPTDDPGERSVSPATPTDAGEVPTDDRELEAILYETGNAAFDIVEDPDHPRLFVERFTYRDSKWFSPFSLTPKAASLLRKESTMILGKFGRRLSLDERGGVRFRNGRVSWFVWYYIVLTKPGEVMVVPRFPVGEPIEVNIDLQKIGVEQPANGLFAWLLGQKEFRFTQGDLELIERYARALVTPGHDPIAEHDHLKTGTAAAAFVPTQPAGYLFATKDERDLESVEFIARTGQHLAVSAARDLYTDASLDQRGNPRARAVLRILSAAAVERRSVSYLYGSQSGPLLLLVGSTPDDPAERLHVIRNDGTFAEPVQVTNSRVIGVSGFDRNWSPTDVLGAEIAARVISGSWERLTFDRRADGTLNAVLTSGVGAEDDAAPPTEWLFRLVSLSPDGRLVVEGTFDGAAIAQDWSSWLANTSIRNPTHRTFDSHDARLWLIGEVTADPDDRRGDWVDDPIDLIHLHRVDP